jgi:hypothetical protein
MATAAASVKLANDMILAVSSSEHANITHFKDRQVALPHHPLIEVSSF